MSRTLFHTKDENIIGEGPGQKCKSQRLEKTDANHVFWTWLGLYTQESTVVVIACTRFIQDQTSQNSSMDAEGDDEIQLFTREL